MGVSTGYNGTEKRRFQIRMLNIVGRNMAFYMMHAYQRQVSCIGNSLGFCHTYKKCTDKPRSIGYTDSINIIQSDVCLVQCFLDDLIDPFYMISGGDLRYNTSVQFMDLDL